MSVLLRRGLAPRGMAARGRGRSLNRLSSRGGRGFGDGGGVLRDHQPGTLATRHHLHPGPHLG
ncbi:hypothetical protein ACF07T_32735 [Streptomyces sp. NPDC015184]|uniref:hypothetical protein n=1 Tax=Streptomyces sp. NPDC015184 TaxID=3364946 RepID=UPI0036FB3994